MKKLLSWMLMCCFLMPCTALADVASQVGAPNAIQAEYESNTGKTVIRLDASITVPAADTVNVYEVKARLFTVEELKNMAEAAFGDREYITSSELSVMPMSLFSGEKTTQYYAQADTVKKVEGQGFPVPESTIYITQRVLKNGMMSRSEMIYNGVNGSSAGPITIYSNEAPRTGEIAAGNLTYEEARAQSDALAQQIAPHMMPAGHGIALGKGLSTGEYTGEEAYAFFSAPLYDLPWHYAEYVMARNYAVPSAEESLRIIISDKRVEEICWTAPHEIVDVVEADVELLPFEQILDVAAQLFPLSQAYAEKTQTLECQITDIRLGYARVFNKDNPNSLLLMPVWDFYGILNRYVDGQLHYSDNRACNSWLTVNAIDGTVIDRGYGY